MTKQTKIEELVGKTEDDMPAAILAAAGKLHGILTDNPKSTLELAEDFLAGIDDGVQLLWDVRGPSKSRVERIGCFLVCPPDGAPTKIICETYASGKYGFYAPARLAMPVAEEAEQG